MNDICTKCGGDLVGVKYHYGHAEHFDGVSEYKCLKCHVRVGRWSGKTLMDGEWEKKSNRFIS